MMDRNLQKVYGQVAQNIDNKNISRAIAMLRKVATQYGRTDMLYPIAKVEEGYGYMLKYVIEGVSDPSRKDMLHNFVIELYRILDSLIFDKRRQIENNLYFNTLRTRQLANSPSIPSLLEAYAAAQGNASLLAMVGTDAKDAKEEYRRLERAEIDLFNAVWTTPFLSDADFAAISQALASDAYSPAFKAYVLSALMLAQLFTFDEKKLELQMRAYLADTPADVSMAALVGMLLGLWQWRGRPLSTSISHILASVKEKDTWHSDLDIACIEFMRAFDTARINKKINDEVIPILRDINSDIQTLIKDTNIDPTDMASLQENPEWEEMLNKSGAKDKLKEITDMQLSGGDVMMSTFAHLKSFPFFFEAANWFLPFRASHSQIADIDAPLKPVISVLEHTDFFCDSDKFSFVLSLHQVPEQQRKFMTSQMSASQEAFAEMRGHDITEPQQRQQLASRYMKNIYRFFKLFSRRDDFPDPFAEGVNLLDVPMLAADLSDPDLVRTIAEFNFSRGYMPDALRAFDQLCSLAEPDAAIYQKMGYVHEKMGEREMAISLYQKAEMLDGDSLWTLRRLAACSRTIGRHDLSVKYYSMLASRLPDDTNIATRLGYAYLEKGDYASALNQFYKVTFMDESSLKPYRPLAWTLLLTGDLDGAAKQYKRIFDAEGAATPGDCLNLGHVYLAKGDNANAVAMYAKAMEMPDYTTENFSETFRSDSDVLKRLGVDPDLLPLIHDAAVLKARH